MFSVGLAEDVDFGLIAVDETARLRADGGMNIFMVMMLIGLRLYLHCLAGC